jgi:hypothetical protein
MAAWWKRGVLTPPQAPQHEDGFRVFCIPTGCVGALVREPVMVGALLAAPSSRAEKRESFVGRGFNPAERDSREARNVALILSRHVVARIATAKAK